MRIRAEVLEVASHGDMLQIKMQGKGRRDAPWRPEGLQTLNVADTAHSRNAFRVGRIVKLDVKVCAS